MLGSHVITGACAFDSSAPPVSSAGFAGTAPMRERGSRVRTARHLKQR